MTKNLIGLTIKHVNQSGTFYISAHSVKTIYPEDGTPSYITFDAGDKTELDEKEFREIRDGTVYLMNMSGKTIDIIILGQIRPSKI